MLEALVHEVERLSPAELAEPAGASLLEFAHEIIGLLEADGQS